MNATINTFPPFQSMNSPRGWILAVIVLLHLGFFLALSSGMRIDMNVFARPPTTLVTPQVEPEKQAPEPEKRIIEMEDFDPRVPMPDPLPLPPEPEKVTATIEPGPSVPTTPTPSIDRSGSAEPVVTLPEIDPRTGLSEPLYPASEIRAEHTGTVLLSIYVLENGRVGDVRLDQTSGYAKLDESAMREAKRWRLKPGMRDGVPVAMWKQIPITFQLQSAGSRRF